MVIVFEVQHWAWDPAREQYAPGILLRNAHELGDEATPEDLAAFLDAARQQADEWLTWGREHFEAAPDHLVEMIRLLLDPSGSAPPTGRERVYLTAGGHEA